MTAGADRHDYRARMERSLTSRRFVGVVAVVTGILLSIAVVSPAAAAPVAIVYVSPTGNDGRSGASPAQAWRSLDAVQAALDDGRIGPGTRVLFRRGGTWRGSLSLDSGTSGTAGAPITLGAYGSGAAPVLSGAVPLSGWTSTGPNRWTARCDACPDSPSMLTVAGEPMPIARWPNADDGDGYRYITGAAGNTVVIDGALPTAGAPTTNWAGGELVVRSIAWVLDRRSIVASTATRFTLAEPTSYPIVAGWGYFVQNHPAALDRPGEWVWDRATRTITVFRPTRPSATAVEVANAPAVIEMIDANDVVVSGLTLRGGRDGNLLASDCTSITVEGVTSERAAGTGIAFIRCVGATVTGTTIRDTGDIGLDAHPCEVCSFTGNTITDIAVRAGMGGSGDGRYLGARVGGPDLLFDGNLIESTGYLALDVRGPSTITRNTIRDFNRVKVDGAGIYLYDTADVTIAENLVSDAPGSTAGIPWDGVATHGIYIDDQSQRVVVRGNTVVDVGSSGVYLHNVRDVEVSGNTLVGAGEQGIALTDDDLGSFSVTGLRVTGNTVVVDRPGGVAVDATTTAAPPNAAFLTSLGTLAGNRYCGVFDDPLFRVHAPGVDDVVALARWQQITGDDATSAGCTYRSPTFRVTGTAGPQLVENGRFDTSIAEWFGWPDNALDASWDPAGLHGGALRVANDGDHPLVHIDTIVGALSAGTTYRLRVAARSDRSGPSVRAYVRQLDAPYATLATPATPALASTPVDRELFFTVTQTDAQSLLIFELGDDGAPVWIDDVELQAVSGRAVAAADVIRVETNPTTTPRRLVVRRAGVGPDGTAYARGDRVVLAPFESLVLLG